MNSQMRHSFEPETHGQLICCLVNTPPREMPGELLTAYLLAIVGAARKYEERSNAMMTGWRLPIGLPDAPATNKPTDRTADPALLKAHRLKCSLDVPFHLLLGILQADPRSAPRSSSLQSGSR